MVEASTARPQHLRHCNVVVLALRGLPYVLLDMQVGGTRHGIGGRRQPSLKALKRQPPSPGCPSRRWSWSEGQPQQVEEGASRRRR